MYYITLLWDEWETYSNNITEENLEAWKNTYNVTHICVFYGDKVPAVRQKYTSIINVTTEVT
jgi:hypothetical protein